MKYISNVIKKLAAITAPEQATKVDAGWPECAKHVGRESK
jgi:hypothetical protein